MSRRGRRTRAVLVVGMLFLAFLGGSVPVAQGSIWTGSCPVQIDFSFGTRVRSATSLGHPGYSFDVSNALGVPCVVSLDTGVFRSTSGGGSGSSITWTCESTAGTGSWSQGWSPSLPPVVGSHVIAGSWGAWTMVVRNPSLSFSGVIELTVNPFEPPDKLAQCELSGIKTLSMVGTMVFQDPEIPAE